MTDPQRDQQKPPQTDSGTESRTVADAPAARKFELSPTQVTGSALAAMTGAFLASYLGTAGTVIGAAVGSLIATVGTTAYTWWLRRTSEVVKRTATQVRETGMGSTVVIPLLPGKGRSGRTHASAAQPADATVSEEGEHGSADGSGDDGCRARATGPGATGPAARGPIAGSGRGTNRGARSRWWPPPSPSSSSAD